MAAPSHQTIRLSKGKHSSPGDGACVVELASMLAGEQFSDQPESVCPVLAGFLRGYNDSLDEGRRQDLYREAAVIVGSRGTAQTRRRRARLVRRWARALGRSGWPSLSVRLSFLTGPVDPIGGYVGHLVATCPDRGESDLLHGEALRLVDRLLAVGTSAEDAPRTPAQHQAQSTKPEAPRSVRERS